MKISISQVKHKNLDALLMESNLLALTIIPESGAKIRLKKPMTKILALLQAIAPLLEKTVLRQMSRVIFGMLAASGRITMLGLSRWTEKGGSYRTIQRFYHTVLSWPALHWLFRLNRFWCKN